MHFNDDLLFIYSDRSRSDKVIVVVSFGCYICWLFEEMKKKTHEISTWLVHI